jgi:hypothetical protein
VGYAEGATRNGFKIMGAQFAAVAGSAIDLTSVTVTGYDKESGTEADVKVQSLDYRGKGGMTYSFYDVPGELFGWLDSFDEPVEEDAVLVQPGEGLWVSSPNTSFQLELPGVTL